MAPPSKLLFRFDQAGPDECWIWTGRIDKYGYGRHSEQRLAHRMVYERLVGPIPPGMTLDHICHDPLVCDGGTSCLHRRCVNPEHLELATRIDNQRRSRPAMKTHCKHGHEFTPENTYQRPDREARRVCRACVNRRSAAYRRRVAA